MVLKFIIIWFCVLCASVFVYVRVCVCVYVCRSSIVITCKVVRCGSLVKSSGRDVALLAVVM